MEKEITRIVLISDTHGMHDGLSIPDADILIHAGDINVTSHLVQLNAFNYWLSQLPHKHKIIIPGNHDLYIEANQKLCIEACDSCHLLIDRGVTVEGLKFWGSPWTPWFNNWAWNLQRGPQLQAVWNQIPNDTDVLITHGPPRNILDLTYWEKLNEGCDDLRSRVFEVRPKLHTVGHIHEGRGVHKEEEILFVNASICNSNYAPINKPIVVELTKTSAEVIDM